jgi:hypothetical protein
MRFGDDNALHDILLKTCYVYHNIEMESKPILVGKWGAGKSAILVHSVGALSELLGEKAEEDSPIWYIGESSIEKDDLARIRQNSRDYESLKANFENIWRTEIIRRACILLDMLKPSYKYPEGSHWEYVSYISRIEFNKRPIWNRYSLSLGKGNTDESLDAILHKKTLDSINKCNIDIKINNFDVKPMIIIEPIDTPTSPIENCELKYNQIAIAEPLIYSLLNVYSQFIKFQRPFNWLKICIPWHRFKLENLDLPDRIRPYYCVIKWDKERLYNFINQRIMYEFSQQKKTIKNVEPWNELFEDTIVHRNLKPKIREGSFDFFIRHTHYRPRELLRLVRFALERQAEKDGLSEENILSDPKSHRITEATMLESIQGYFDLNTTKLFLEEVKRKYGEYVCQDMVSLLNGISVPFSSEELNRRHRRFFGNELAYFQLTELIDRLWESGIIGIELVPSSSRMSDETTKTLNDLTRIFGKGPYRAYNPVGENYSIHRWYLFDFNCEGSAANLLTAFDKNENVNIGLILHPSLKQYFFSNSNCPCPIG